MLLQEIIEKAKLMGYEQIELGVFADNKRAQALYKKMDLKFGDAQRMHNL